MDKLLDTYKGVVALFHGIIATWLFLDFSERHAEEFQFLILLIFFSVLNVLLWRSILAVAQRLGWKGRTTAIATELEIKPYRFGDAIGLTAIAVCVGLLAAYLDRHDVVLRVANTITNWQRTGSETPFDTLVESVVNRSSHDFDNRAPELVKAARAEGSYLRVYKKDSKFGHEGYPGVVPTRGEEKERGFVLTPACRFWQDAKDLTSSGVMQRIEGPGVFLQMTEFISIEIIDARQSTCNKLAGG